VALPIHLFRHFVVVVYRLPTVHSVTDRRTDIQTDSQMTLLYNKARFLFFSADFDEHL